MPFLIAAVILLGVLCALDLVLTIGVIKRLREHTERLALMGGGFATIDVGAEISAFESVTVDGVRLVRESLTEETVVAFFSPNCEPCKEKLPQFAEYVRTRPGGRSRALAVVVGEGDAGAPFVTALSPIAHVVVEGQNGPLNSAFRTTSYPTVVRVAPDGGGRLVVTASHVELGRSAVSAA
ncbi:MULTISPECIES: TlpA family protein disulfide reductase [Streptomyces]|uniref:Thioredoxin domain-containing protein n=1 Tax=Streptomyces siderophoricus TaxID=2802281 RepID=A0ABS1N0H8_9ACTN|nr:hypothetical protein [Streptomyces sp. 9-7]MBL1093450.1 hypothetical protein [Streptomyces sp. 9-7]